jgi:predicted outer membrane protein
MTRTIRLLPAVGVLALAVACGGDTKEQRAPDTPVARAVDSTEALAYMAAVDQSKIEAAQRGARRASDTEVRQFAQLLWREHARSGREVAELARQLELDLRAAAQRSPMVANVRTMSQQTTQLLDRIPRSVEFDRTYIDSQVRAHQAVLQDLRRIVAGSGQIVAAGVAPGGGVDVGVTPSATAAGATAAARRLRDRRPETSQEAAQMMLARVQQHLDRARQIRSRLAGGAR